MTDIETGAVTQEVSAPEASSVPAITQSEATVRPSSSTPDALTSGGTSPVETQPAAPEWKPDFKFKYRADKADDQLEGEIDEWARGLITNKEIEEKVKALYSKAHGLDFIKNKHSRVVEEYKNFKSQTEPLVQSWNTLSEHYSRGDMESFFKGLQIPDDTIYKYVADKLRYQELPPEQRAEHDRVTQTQRQAFELQQQNQQLQHQYQQAEIRNREIQLNTALSAPDMQQMATEFDKRTGTSGAFKEEVIMRGVALFQKTGRDYTPEEVIQTMRGLYTPASASSSMPMSQQSGMPTPTQTSSAPTIPNVGGKNSAPVKRSIKSLADLRKHADSLG